MVKYGSAPATSSDNVDASEPGILVPPILSRASSSRRVLPEVGNSGSAALPMLFRLTPQPYSGNLQRAFGHSLEAVQIVEELLTRQSLEECLCRLISASYTGLGGIG